jgi:two-component system nitrogen regulation response regulator NtrX
MIGDDAMVALQAYDWPGNVRQLRNNIERLLILANDDPGAVITADKLPPDVGTASLPIASGNGHEPLIAMPLREAREHFERQYLTAQISRFGGNISRTASFIGMERSALHRKLKSLGVTTNHRGQSYDA